VRRDLLYAALGAGRKRPPALRRPPGGLRAIRRIGRGQIGFPRLHGWDEAWYSGANRIGKSTRLPCGVRPSAVRQTRNPKAAYLRRGIVIYDKAVNIWIVSPTLRIVARHMQPRCSTTGTSPPARTASSEARDRALARGNSILV